MIDAKNLFNFYLFGKFLSFTTIALDDWQVLARAHTSVFMNEIFVLMFIKNWYKIFEINVKLTNYWLELLSFMIRTERIMFCKQKKNLLKITAPMNRLIVIQIVVEKRCVRKRLFKISFNDDVEKLMYKFS